MQPFECLGVIGADIDPLRGFTTDLAQAFWIDGTQDQGNHAFAHEFSCASLASAPIRLEPILADQHEDDLSFTHVALQGPAPFFTGRDPAFLVTRHESGKSLAPQPIQQLLGEPGVAARIANKYVRHVGATAANANSADRGSRSRARTDEPGRLARARARRAPLEAIWRVRADRTAVPSFYSFASWCSPCKAPLEIKFAASTPAF